MRLDRQPSRLPRTPSPNVCPVGHWAVTLAWFRACNVEGGVTVDVAVDVKGRVKVKVKVKAEE